MRSGRHPRSFGIALAIALVITGASTIGFAQSDTGTEPRGEPIVQGPDEALEFDAHMYADAFNVDLETAIRNLKLQDAAGELRMALEAAEPEAYAGQFAEHGPDYSVVVMLTDGDPNRLTPYISDSPLEDIVEVRKVAYSSAELKSQHQALINLMRDVDLKYNSETNLRENRVDLLVTDRQELDEALLAKERSLPDNVAVVEVESLASDEVEAPQLSDLTYGQSALASHGVDIRGGRALSPVCTVGFLSAGHCRYGLSVFWSVNGVETPLVNEWRTGPYDVQWNSTPHHAVYNQVMVRYFPFNVRTITGVKSYAAMNLNDWVCVFGKSHSTQICGEIVNLNLNPGSPNNCACFVRVSHPSGANLSIGGDSGAPWYSGNHAWGVHKGSVPDGGADGYFMPVDRISNFGLSVLTWCPSGGC